MSRCIYCYLKLNMILTFSGLKMFQTTPSNAMDFRNTSLLSDFNCRPSEKRARPEITILSHFL